MTKFEINHFKFWFFTLFIGSVCIALPFILNKSELTRYGFFSEIRQSRYEIMPVLNGFELKFHIDRDQFGILRVLLKRNQDFHVLEGTARVSLTGPEGHILAQKSVKTSEIDTQKAVEIFGFEPQKGSSGRDYKVRFQFQPAEFALQYLSATGLKLETVSFSDFSAHARTGGNAATFIMSKITIVWNKLTPIQRVIFVYLAFLYYPIYVFIRMYLLTGKVIAECIRFIKDVLKQIAVKWSHQDNRYFAKLNDDRELIRVYQGLLNDLFAGIRQQLYTYWDSYSRYGISLLWLLTSIIYYKATIQVQQMENILYLWWVIGYTAMAIILRFSSRVVYFTAGVGILFCNLYLNTEGSDTLLAQRLSILTFLHLLLALSMDLAQRIRPQS